MQGMFFEMISGVIFCMGSILNLKALCAEAILQVYTYIPVPVFVKLPQSSTST
jgi:hypothetical protein